MEYTFKFDHEASKTNLALGISNEMDGKITDIIIFCTASNHFIKNEMFGDDEDEAPRNITTMSGDLEKCLSLCESQLEIEYLLLNFKSTHELTLELIAKMKMLDKESNNPLEKLKHELMMKLMDFKVREGLDEIDSEDHIRMMPSQLFNKVEIAKRNKYDYKKFVSELNADDIINNVFKNDK